jgi:tetratricopeptide (TPR) repeat protein
MIELGIQAQAEGRLQRALDFYDRASVLAPYLHEAYWRKAVVYHALGELPRAEDLLQQAMDKASRDHDRRLYHAKLATLDRDHQH